MNPKLLIREQTTMPQVATLKCLQTPGSYPRTAFIIALEFHCLI